MSMLDIVGIISILLLIWVCSVLAWSLHKEAKQRKQSEAEREAVTAELARERQDHLRNAELVRIADDVQRSTAARLTDATSEGQRLSAALVDAHAERQRTAGELSSSQTELSGLAQSLEQSRREVLRLSQDLERFKPLVDLRRACDEAQSELTRIRAEAAALAQRSEKELQDKLTQIRSETAAAAVQAANQKARSTDELQELAARVKHLSSELAALEEKDLLQSFGFYQPRYALTNSEAYKARLAEIRDQQKEMLKERRAATCKIAWTIDGSTKKGEKHTNDYLKLMLRGFNGECDACVAQVKYNNVHVMESRIQKAFDAINKLSASNQCEIARTYLDLKLAELHLSHEYQEKRQDEIEEQRRLREQMKDEEKAQAELDRTRREAEAEEKRFEAALAKARADVEGAAGARQAKLMEEITRLQERLEQAHQVKERAVSRAQQTRSGHVYVISNIGSFGEDVYKIGMTRREDPLDRVRELGDASVPFQFDIHAIIQTDDAPALENALHRRFHANRVNRINERKEFFRVTLAEIEAIVHEHHGHIEFKREAEAVEYRKTLAMAAANAVIPLPLPVPVPVPKPVRRKEAFL